MNGMDTKLEIVYFSPCVEIIQDCVHCSTYFVNLTIDCTEMSVYFIPKYISLFSMIFISQLCCIL
jgi:hypothetical protein